MRTYPDFTLSKLDSIQIPPRPGGGRRPQGNRPGLGRILHHGWRHTRRLFHVAVGLAFLLFAAAGAAQSFAEWQSYARAPANGLWRFEVVTGFTVLLVIFGIYSFVRARSVR